MAPTVSWIAHEIYLWMMNEEGVYRAIRSELRHLAKRNQLTATNVKVTIENYVTYYAAALEKNGTIPAGSRFKRGVISGASKELYAFFSNDIRAAKQDFR